MHEPDLHSARAYALERLERELSPELTYHSPAHTWDDIVPAAERLAAMESVTGPDLVLLRTAAFFHDLGFVEQYEDHETASMRIASQVLPRFGYSPVQIQVIAGMIRATRLPQSPHTLMEEIMADADLDVLGRDDYLALNFALRAELSCFGKTMTDEEWYGGQLRFIQTHRYWTASARALRDAKKQENIAAMARLLAESRASRAESEPGMRR